MANMPKLKKDVKKESESLKIIIIFLMTLASIFFILISRNIQESANQAEYESLMAESRYLEAADLAPEHLESIEEEIASKGDNGIEDLKRLIEKYPDLHSAKFDLAYLEEDYERVIELAYIADTEIRKKHLAISYIETGQLEEAREINQEIKDPEITNRLEKAEQNN